MSSAVHLNDDKREFSEIHKDIPLGKLLLGLTYLSEAAPKSRFHTVRVNLSKLGVALGCGEYSNGYQYFPWGRILQQLPPQNTKLLWLYAVSDHNESAVAVRTGNLVIFRFTIGRTFFRIGVERELFSMCHFFNDVYNLILFRGASVRVTLCRRWEAWRLPVLESHDHGYQLVELHPCLVRLAAYIRSLCVISLDESSSSSSLSSNSASDEFTAWKVWNWKTHDYISAFGDSPERDDYIHFNSGFNRSSDYTDGYGDIDCDFEDYRPTESRVYPKEFILSLRNSPLARQKPENADRINSVVKSFNGFRGSQFDTLDEEPKKYSRKFLLSLRYAPMSVRRPVYVERPNLSASSRNSFKQGKENMGGSWPMSEKEPYWPRLQRRARSGNYDQLHCALHGFKRF